MKDDEVWMARLSTDWNVVPDQIVGFELRFEALGKAAFAARYARLT
jgi:hypothetical protein